MKKYLNITVNEVFAPQTDASTASSKLDELAEFVSSMHRNNLLLESQTELLRELEEQIRRAAADVSFEHHVWFEL